MAGQSEFFSSFTELEARPAFSLDNSITVENFVALIGEYHFEEQVKCQLLKEKGICNHLHNHGWVGLNTAGQEALIGNNCAQNHFNAHSGFRQEKSRVTREIKRRKALAEIQDYIDRKDEILMTLDNIKNTAVEVRRITDNINKSFPGDVVRFIFNAQRTTNWEVRIDIRNPYNNSKMLRKWKVATLGNIKPLPVHREVVSLIGKIKEFKAFCELVFQCEPDTIKTPRLLKTVESLVEIKSLIDKSKQFSMLANEFIKKRNLEMLVYVCNSNDEQYITARAIMSIEGKSNLTSRDIENRLKRIKTSISKKFDGFDIRPNMITDALQKSTVFAE